MAAVEAYQKLEAQGYVASCYYLGYSRLKLGHYSDAADDFSRCLRQGVSIWEVHFGLGRALLEQNKLKEARAALTHAAADSAATIEVTYTLGLVAQRQGKYGEAERLFAEVLQQNSRHAGAAYNRAQSLLRLGRAEEAAQWLLRHRELADEADRLQSLRQVVSYPSATAADWISLGDALAEAGQLEEARNSYQRAFELAPEPAVVRFHLGLAEYQLGRYAAAIEQFEAFVAAYPGDVGGWFNLGRSASEAGQPQRAIDAFHHAMRLRPEEPRAMAALCATLLEVQRWDEAADLAGKLTEMLPDEPLHHFWLATALQRLGRLADAESSAARAVALAPGESSYSALLESIQRGRKRP